MATRRLMRQAKEEKGMSNYEGIAPHSHNIDIKALRWVAKATSTDSYRHELRFAAAYHYRGFTWLAGTDTHRVHAYRLRASDPHEPVIIDIKRVLHEMRYEGANVFSFELDGTAAIGSVPRKILYWEPQTIYAPIIASNVGRFPNLNRILDSIMDIKTCPTQIALSPKYLAQATELSNGVILRGTDARSAVIIEPNDSPASWFAVVMGRNPEHPVFAQLDDESQPAHEGP